jgi:hypothetical protein
MLGSEGTVVAVAGKKREERRKMNVNVLRDTREPNGPRDLDLTVEDMQRVVDTLSALREARLRVRGDLEVASCLITVRWVDDQREGSYPLITGIRRA